MSLKTRLEKLEATKEGKDSCPNCAPAHRIRIYKEGEEPRQEPQPRYCPRCGRDQGVNRIVVMLPDNYRDAA